MEVYEQAEKDIVVRGERCRVTAVKAKGTWKASGSHRGKVVAVHRAPTPDRAFEWWANKAHTQLSE